MAVRGVGGVRLAGKLGAPLAAVDPWGATSGEHECSWCIGFVTACCIPWREPRAAFRCASCGLERQVWHLPLDVFILVFVVVIIVVAVAVVVVLIVTTGITVVILVVLIVVVFLITRITAVVLVVFIVIATAVGIISLSLSLSSFPSSSPLIIATVTVVVGDATVA